MDLLEALCNAPGVSGYEDAAQDIVQQALEPVCDRLWRDRVGNLIALRRGSLGERAPRVMLAAHVDEIGLMVTHIDEAGFLRFRAVGGFDASTLMSQRVLVHGRKALHGVIAPRIRGASNANDKEPTLSDLYVDLGLPAQRVADTVRIGDIISLAQPFAHLNDEVVTARNFDDRLGVYCLIEAMRALQAPKVDVYAVSTVQEELGVRGAPMAAHAILPDAGLAIDGSLAWDVPVMPSHEQHCRLGQGTGIYYLDNLTMGSPRLIRFLESLCERQSIPFQRNVGGGTDASAIQRTGLGALATTIGAPTRYMHSTVQMAHLTDIHATIALLAAFGENAHELLGERHVSD